MPIDFPTSPSSGQRYDYLSKSWIWNSVYWVSVGASGNVTSGQLGTPVVFSGNIASGQIGSFHLASGVGGSSLTSGSVTSGFIGNAAVVSGSIGSGQISYPHIAVTSGFIAGQMLAISYSGTLYFSNIDGGTF